VDEVAAICAFLRKKGYTRLEQTFKAELEAEARHAVAKTNAPRPSLVPQEPTQLQSLQPITIKELAAKSAPRDLGASGTNEAAGPEQADAAEALAKDPTDTSRGFRMIRNWCEGSLEVYQVSNLQGACTWQLN
jgi:transcription initiation factor TFIID subunit 5